VRVHVCGIWRMDVNVQHLQRAGRPLLSIDLSTLEE
jgi:hypothetical protein